MPSAHHRGVHMCRSAELHAWKLSWTRTHVHMHMHMVILWGLMSQVQGRQEKISISGFHLRVHCRGTGWIHAEYIWLALLPVWTDLKISISTSKSASSYSHLAGQRTVGCTHWSHLPGDGPWAAAVWPLQYRMGKRSYPAVVCPTDGRSCAAETHL